MTYLDLTDRRLVDELVERAGTHTPDYIDEVLAMTARTHQRPAWRFPGRWLPLADGLRPMLRWALVATLLGLAALGLLLAWAGSRPAPPLTGNGLIVTGVFGDLPVTAGGAVRFATVDPATGVVSQDPGASWGGVVLGFSPDGSRIAYLVTSEGGDFPWMSKLTDFSYVSWPLSLYASALDGSNTVQLATELFGVGEQASWSPDGRRMVVSIASGARIAIVETDGSGMRVVDFRYGAEGPLAADGATWRPTGDRILFQGRSADAAALYTIAVDGPPEPVFLAEVDREDGSEGMVPPEAAWSPDGRLVAYLRGPGAGGSPAEWKAPTTLHVVGADGTGRRVLLAKGVASHLRWSPDGSALLVRHAELVSATEGWEVRLLVVPLDGSPPMAIGPATTGIFATESLESFAWSPDSSMVVAGPLYVPDDTGQGATGIPAVLISVEAGTWTRLDLPRSRHPGDSTFHWQPVAP